MNVDLEALNLLPKTQRKVILYCKIAFKMLSQHKSFLGSVVSGRKCFQHFQSGQMKANYIIIAVVP